jgi:hypothetical protein
MRDPASTRAIWLVCVNNRLLDPKRGREGMLAHIQGSSRNQSATDSSIQRKR